MKMNKDLKNLMKYAGSLLVGVALGAPLGGAIVDQYYKDTMKGPEWHPNFYNRVTVQASQNTQVYFKKSIDNDKPWRPFPPGENPSMLLEKCLYNFKIQQLGPESDVKQRVNCTYAANIEFEAHEWNTQSD